MTNQQEKLAAAEQILRAETWSEMTRALDSWFLFFQYPCPAFNTCDSVVSGRDISESYETLRQRAHEYSVSYRISQIEERLGLGRDDS